MGKALFTPSQVLSMQSLIIENALSTVVVYAPVYADDSISDDVPSFGAPIATVPGWLLSKPSRQLVQEGGHMVSEQVYRLRIPVDTPIAPRYEVVVDGNRYVVIDTDDRSTWRDTVEVTIRAHR
jgi:hypothetical protein